MPTSFSVASSAQVERSDAIPEIALHSEYCASRCQMPPSPSPPTSTLRSPATPPLQSARGAMSTTMCAPSPRRRFGPRQAAPALQRVLHEHAHLVQDDPAVAVQSVDAKVAVAAAAHVLQALPRARPLTALRTGSWRPGTPKTLAGSIQPMVRPRRTARRRL